MLDVTRVDFLENYVIILVNKRLILDIAKPNWRLKINVGRLCSRNPPNRTDMLTLEIIIIILRFLSEFEH